MPTDQTAQWRVVDDWWERASTTNTETITDLQALFEALNEQWRDSPASFDRDPLYAEWRTTGHSAPHKKKTGPNGSRTCVIPRRRVQCRPRVQSTRQVPSRRYGAFDGE